MNQTVYGAEKTSFTIKGLEADKVYCVKMKSQSLVGSSHFTQPIKHKVFRTGNNI